MKKTKPTSHTEIERQWHLIDAKGKVLGRVSTRIAKLLIGKDKPYFAPNLDCGDFVVVINAKDVAVTGKKETDKIYFRHSGYPGGLKSEALGDLRKRMPEKIIERAVRGMLPKNKLQGRRMTRLKVYPGFEHPHQAQVGEKHTD